MHRVLLIAFFAIWFTAVLPGHERGVVRTAGEDGSQVFAAESCCPSDDQPTRDPVRTCALCQLLATLDAPPALLDVTPIVERIAYARPLAPHRPVGRFVVSTTRQRAPPIAPVL